MWSVKCAEVKQLFANYDLQCVQTTNKGGYYRVLSDVDLSPVHSKNEKNRNLGHDSKDP